jgi:hypothetical protein
MSEIIITDIKMPFISMVIFMVKAAIAAIPAMIIIGIIGSVIGSFIIGLSSAV